MHIPDAVLSPAVCATTGAVASVGLVAGLRKLRGQVGERTIPLMGTMAAFVFAAQMVNFPLYPLPISGHLLGGVLSAVLLGPWAGAVVIAAVLLVQCLVFGDGGVTALGANFLNKGLIGSLGGYAIYDPVRRLIGGRAGVLVGAMVAAWFSVLLAAGAFAVELAASGRLAGFFDVLGWMVLIHAVIGLGEAVITGLVLRFILLARPDVVHEAAEEAGRSACRFGQVAVAGLAVALAVAAFLAPLASEHPDGLEWAGQRLGFLDEGEALFAPPIPDYQLPLPGLRHAKLATAAAGLVGTLVVFGLGIGFARVFSGRGAVVTGAESS